MKSHQFGQGFEYNKTTKMSRLSIIIILSSIAHWLLMAIGLATQNENKHRQYQANDTAVLKSFEAAPLIWWSLYH